MPISPEKKLSNAIDRSLHLLTDFIQLRERYALLHPMLFNVSVQWPYGDRKQWRGFDAMRRSLFLSCCQDVYKLSCDRAGPYCVSIEKCLDDLRDGKVRKQLRMQYVAAELAIDSNHPDPVVAAIDLALVPERTIKYGNDFDSKCDAVIAEWQDFRRRPTLRGCDTIRNELTAHTKLAGPSFDPINIFDLRVDLNDLGPTIAAMQELVAHVGAVVRGADFAWQQLDRIVTTAANDFWLDKSTVSESL